MFIITSKLCFNRNEKPYIPGLLSLLVILPLLQNKAKPQRTEQFKEEVFSWPTVSGDPACPSRLAWWCTPSVTWGEGHSQWSGPGSRERTWAFQGWSLVSGRPHPLRFPQPPKIVPPAGNKHSKYESLVVRVGSKPQ